MIHKNRKICIVFILFLYLLKECSMLEKDNKLYTYTYTLPKNHNWKFCPYCNKRLFEVVESKGFVIEIKCRRCKKVVTIEDRSGNVGDLSR